MVTTEEIDGTVVVRLDHGPVNALDLELCEAITETFATLTEAGAIVLTGSGRAFSAGVDLKRLVEGGPEHVARFLPALNEALLAVFVHPRPVVTAVNGHAIAGGCLLAVGADRRLMSAGTIGMTELAVGVPFPAVAMEIARWAAGREVGGLATTAATLRPPDAEAAGLVDEVVEPDVLLEAAMERARWLGEIPRATFAVTKEQLRSGALAAIADSGASDARVVEIWQSPEVLGRMALYLESLTQR